MDIVFPVEKTVKERVSVRTYEERPLSSKEKEKINAYIKTLKNPFQVNVSFRLLETEKAVKGEKLGTYGMIKGAKDFIGAAVEEGDLALEALGYSFEELILYATSLGLGTCWLGGSFNRSGFANAMQIKENELFPTITPIGYPVGKKRVTESLVRWAAKSDKRKEWEELFYNKNFSTNLSKKDAGEFAYPLEMLRLAPSAANKQPWRVLYADHAYHFYEAKSLGDQKPGIDIQRVDVGIGACHFHLAVMEKGLPGTFRKISKPVIHESNQFQYIFSWVIE